MTDPITPDQLVLMPDGTAVMAWPETPVEFDERGRAVGSGLFVPAWTIRRPRVRELRHLTETWHTLLTARRDAQLRLTEEAARLRDRIAAGEDMSDVEVEAATSAANDMIASTEAVAWPWWLECVDLLGTPIGAPWPRDVDDADAPPWLTQNSAVYSGLTLHWQTVPLVRGVSLAPPATTTPTGRVPIQKG